MSLVRWLATALLPLGLAVPGGAQPGASKLGSHVVAQLAARGKVEVLVMLADPLDPPGSTWQLRARQRAVAQLRTTVLASLPSADVQVHRQFVLASGFTAAVTAAGVQALLAQPAVVRVDEMQWGAAALAESVPQIRADAVHRRDDFGGGVTVAMLDNGVDSTHPDLDGSIVGEQCFCRGCCPDGSDEQAGPGSAVSAAVVHATHVAGIIVSKGIVAPLGVAPAAKLVVVKVLNERNRGELVDWIAALDWIATRRPDVQAVNMSLASAAVYPDSCDDADAYTMAFAQELRGLRARGTLTFVASGNTGQSRALASPACVGAAVAVGAVTKSDRFWPGTDRGTALDVLAPGVSIVSAGLDHGTARLTGTSMATAHATGVAALLLSINPQVEADVLERLLTERGVPISDARSGLTFPRLDALAAMNAVWRVTRPLLGGGGAGSDCLVEWNVRGPTLPGLLTGSVCVDNDRRCDADDVPGQCVFQLSTCFNVPDRRLPHCNAATIETYRLTLPSVATDPVNAAAISAALPALPITEENRCTDTYPIVVPVGATERIHFSAGAADGRRDVDRLLLRCVPAQH